MQIIPFPANPLPPQILYVADPIAAVTLFGSIYSNLPSITTYSAGAAGLYYTLLAIGMIWNWAKRTFGKD